MGNKHMSIWTIGTDSKHHSLRVRLGSKFKKVPWFKGKPIGDAWSPLEVSINAYDVYEDTWATPNPGDFPYFRVGGVLACSERALKVLEPLVAPYIEILPLYCKQGNFFALNVLNVIDCIDTGRSVIEYFSDRPPDIHKLRFNLECVGDVPIFKIPQRILTTIFVSDAFKSLVEGYHLEGLIFTLMPED
jgi:uncharacterized protein DUF1629